MAKIDMQKILKEEFKNDAIYRLAVLYGLENDLFTEGILNLLIDTNYSTVEAGKIIGKPDSTIRNHFRSDLVDYISPVRCGKYYRLNYQSIFRMQLIFLLMGQASKTTIDLLAHIDEHQKKSEKVNAIGRGEVRKKGLDNLQEDEKFIDYSCKIIGHYDELKDLRIKILNFEKEIEEIDETIDCCHSEMSFFQEMLALYPTQTLKEKHKRSGIFGFWKKKDEIDEKLLDNIAKINKKIKEYEIRINNLINDKNLLKNSQMRVKEALIREFMNFEEILKTDSFSY